MSGFYLFDDSRVTFEGQEMVPLPDGSDWGTPELRTICLQLDAFLTATENLPENTTLSSEAPAPKPKKDGKQATKT